MKISNILVATDFSPSAANAVATAIDFARQFQAQLIVLHAYRVDIPVASPLTGGGYILPDGFFEQLAKEARLRVEKVASEASAEGISAVHQYFANSPLGEFGVTSVVLQDVAFRFEADPSEADRRMRAMSSSW